MRQSLWNGLHYKEGRQTYGSPFEKTLSLKAKNIFVQKRGRLSTYYDMGPWG